MNSVNTLINYHVPDPSNVGDLLSSPLRYFDFPGFACSAKDIREVENFNIKEVHTIIGGGGLLFERFLPQIESLMKSHQGKKIFWGVGQQRYGRKKCNPYLADYKPYFSNCDLIGLRDYGMDYPWVPCVSCMHPAFDKPRTAKHEFVVLSHKKFQISFPDFPRMTNENTNFEEVLDFLGSGETILTSSFHAAYWGTLLNRKVLVFPFNSKFFTMKHCPAIYPAEDWTHVRWTLSLFRKTLYKITYPGNLHYCETKNWQDYAKKTRTYPDSLDECRERNRWFYERVMETINN